MKKHIQFMKGKKVLSLLLAMVMMLSIASPALGAYEFDPSTIPASQKYPVELAYNNLFVFDNWARNELSTTIMAFKTVDGNIETYESTDEVAYNINSGSFSITKNDTTATQYYTAHAGDTKEKDNNANYYTVDVESNTTYTFSYTLESSNLSAFIPYVFYFKDVDGGTLALPTPGSTADANGKYPAYSSLCVATNLNGSNSWTFTTPADTDRIQLRFTISGTDSAIANVTVKDIVICKSELLESSEENLFSLQGWADNANSSTALGTGSISPNVANDSISFTVDAAQSGIFWSGFSINATDGAANQAYYTVDVEPNSTYDFYYNLSEYQGLTGCTYFQPYIVRMDADGKCIDYFGYATPNYGYNKFSFTTNEKTESIQVVFSVHNAGASCTVKDIEICQSENIFNFSEWESKTSNNAAVDYGYNDGTITTDTGAGSIAFNTTTSADEILGLSPNFSLLGCDGFYTMSVKPNTTYTLSYELFNCDNFVGFGPAIAYYNGSNELKGTLNTSATTYNFNSVSFTTPDDTTLMQIAFGAFHQNNVGTGSVRNIVVSNSTFKDITGTPHRGVFEYQHANADTRTYGTLPEATAPEGYVFGGWFTGENGTGERITPETKIKYESFSVFANFEPEVDKDSLEIVSKPEKLIYTVGEKLNTAGLSLKATQTTIQTVDKWVDTNGNGEVDEGDEFTTVEEEVTRTIHINSNIYCTPEYLTSAGTQTITAHYGGQTVTFPVTVLAADEIDGIVLDGAVKDDISVTNNNYTLNHTAPAAFNRYKITYISDSYVRGIITFVEDDSTTTDIDESVTEEFFLEPSDGNEPFVSFIDEFLDETNNTHSEIKSIQFTCLDNELGNFQLKAVATEFQDGIPKVAYFTNDEYEMGIDIRYGGVVSELYDLSSKKVTARVYDDPENRLSYTDEAGNHHYRTLTLVDYEEKLDEREASYKSDNDTTYNLTDKETDASTRVNLINTLDRGRYLQQSYYGTSDRPYVPGSFNNADWKYNPVQGGNVGLEPSKVIDYEVTDTYVYVKARPMEWEKWSDEHALNCTCEEKYYDDQGVLQTRYTHKDKCYYGSDVISDTYVEAWYYFDDGMIKVNNRKVDYSGLPEATTEQELPALYLIEPLNHFVYNDVTEDNAWSVDKLTESTSTYKNIEEPEFWGISEDYHENYYVTIDTETGKITNVVNDNNKDDRYDLFIKSKENWAAFTASEDADSFGVGVYSPGVEEMYYGVMPEKYASKPTENGLEYLNTYNYRHAETLEPTEELPTSYIAPLDRRTFRSYEATEYTYYLTTGTADEIYNDFKSIGDKEAAEELAKTKVAVPETVYLNPADNLNGQYYVNNLLDSGNFYNVVTEADSDDTAMYFGLHVKDAKSFSVQVTNATKSTNDIVLCDSSGTSIEGSTIGFPDGGDGTYTNETYKLKLSTALSSGDTATAKWVITVTMEDGSTRTHTAYTVLYAPGRTVGAVAEGRVTSGCNNEISSWITGANGVDHSQSAPLGSFYGDSNASGYFKADPLYNGVPTSGGSSETNYDYINVSDTAKYVRQVATKGSNSSVSQSYLGLLAVDKSRYTNTNQIPNLEIGWDALRIDSTNPNNSLQNYDTYYTLGTNESYNTTSHSEAPSGWTHFSSYTDTNKTKAIPFRETIVPAYTVSDDMDGKYIHALNQGMCTWTLAGNRYSTAGTSVLIDITDKSELRDAVLNGYTQNNNDPVFVEKLENAATILGDPSSTQDEINNAKQELNESATVEYYALKYDNLFSALEFSQHEANMTVSKSRGSATYSDGAIIINNKAFELDKETYPDDTAEAYTNYGSTDNYYLIDLSPNTEYVFEYDVETDKASQAFIFFYNSNGGNGDAPKVSAEETADTGYYVQTDGGAWVFDSESNPWIGNYQGSAGTKQYAIKFTTGANTVKAGFRFGNTTNEICKSTFSNIKLVDSAHYYEDVTYSATEKTYKEYTAYGDLPTLTRPGYVFGGWNTAADGSGTVVTGNVLATEHKTIYSQWNANRYTVYFSKNGADGTLTDTYVDSLDGQTKLYDIGINVAYEEEFTLPSSAGLEKDGYEFAGWATSADALYPEYYPGDTVSKLMGENTTGEEFTFHAVWVDTRVNVMFDNILNFDAWRKEATGGTISNVTDTGLTLTADSGSSEATTSSRLFPVTEGRSYTVDVDISGTNWDVWFICLDENNNWVEGAYSSFNSGSSYTFNVPAGKGIVNAQIRLDANDSGNSVGFNNIRVHDTAIDTAVSPVNKYVEFGTKCGALPTPVRKGYIFTGWVDENGNSVTADTVFADKYDVYLTSTWATDYSINNDTIVIDYGLPVKIDLLSNDNNATAVNAIGTGVSADTSLKDTGYTSSHLTDVADTITLANGTATINKATGVVTYTPKSSNYTKEEVFYYDVISDGKHYHAKVTIIPATSIYYEDTFFTYVDSEGKNGQEYKWENLGTPVSDVFQSTDRPGAFNIADDTNDIYGYDGSYDSDTAYSGGSAHYVKVDKNAIGSEPSAKFTFTGTGFDLFSVTDNKSGSLRIIVYKHGETTQYKSYFVNTYFGYDYDAENSKYVPVAPGDNDENYRAIFQVPVASLHNIGEYGTYDVEIKPIYSSAFDVNKAGSYGIYVDSVRIFDPMGEENAIANEAYMADDEYAPQYLELRDTLITPKFNDDGSFADDFKVSELLGENVSLFMDGGKTLPSDLGKLGPKNEVYLGKGQSITFHIVTDSAVLPATMHVGMKLTGKGDITGKATIMNSAYSSWNADYELTSTNERYYDMEAVVEWKLQTDGTYKTAHPIVITNTSDTETIISLTSLKWAFDETAATTTLSLFSDEQTPVLAMAALKRMANEEIGENPQDTILNKENIFVEFSGEPYAVGDNGTLIITTEQGVAGVTVNGTDVVSCETDENGKLQWTYEFTADTAGYVTFDVVARDENGVTSETVYATTTVTDDSQEDGDGEDITTPEGDGSDSEDDSDSGISFIPGDELFAYNLVRLIFQFFEKIIGMLSGGATV